MDAGTTPFDDPSTSPCAFASTLAELKREGGGLLLVGDVPPQVGDPMRRRLLGEESTRRRHRIYVSTRDPPGARFPFEAREIAPERWDVLRHGGATRSAAATSATSPDPAVTLPTGRECPTIGDLGTALVTAIEAADRRHGGLDPAQLRVGFDSVSPILDHDEALAFRFLHLVVQSVKATGGMVHCPLYHPLDSPPVRLFAPLFDAIVELRTHDDETHQRWHFTDSDVRSDWLTTSR